MKKQIVIVGGGIAGIVSALTAAKLGFNTILVERQKNIGGLLRSFESPSGYIFDYGTHLLNRTGNSELDNMVYDDVDQELYNSLPKSGNGTFYKSLDDDHSFLDTRKILGNDYNLAMIELLECNISKANFVNLEDQLKLTFGYTIYTKIMSPIIRKLFGVDAKLLNSDSHLVFGLRRFIAFSSRTSDLLKNIEVYDNKLAYHKDKDFVCQIDESSGSFYPNKGGIGSWINVLHDKLINSEVTIYTEESISDVEYHNQKITDITLKSGEKIRCDHIVWTLPAVLLSNIINKENNKNAKKPVFMSVSLYHFVIDKPYLTKSYYLYFYDPSFRTFRATFYNNFRANKTDGYLVTVEVISNPTYQSIPDKQDIFNELKKSKSIPNDASYTEFSLDKVSSGFPLPTMELVQNNRHTNSKMMENFHNISILGKSFEGGFFMKDVMIASFNEIHEVANTMK